MKLFSFLVGLVVMALSSTLVAAGNLANPGDAQNTLECGRKNINVLYAIRKFCNAPHNIMVPSVYAGTGAIVGGARVYISGWCDPPQWVPPTICAMQFRDVCANIPNGPFGSAYPAGKEYQCQTWHIVHS